MSEHTRNDVMHTLTLTHLEELTGLPAPHGADAEAERAYRELAWENIKVDAAARAEQVPLDGEVGERT